jgi:hypothetical protein
MTTPISDDDLEQFKLAVAYMATREHAIMRDASFMQSIIARIEALTAERDAAVARAIAAEADIPIVANGERIGIARRPKRIEAHLDERGEVWTPPTGWAYWKACQDRDAGITEGERRATAAIVAFGRAVYLQNDVLSQFLNEVERGDHLTAHKPLDT